MDREQLLKNLQELENQLRGVKSATEQVNAVVKLDRELTNSVNTYTQKAQEYIAAIKEQFTGLEDLINKSLKPLIEDELKPLPESVRKAAEQTLKEMKRIEESLYDTATDVKGSIIAAGEGYIKEMGNLGELISSQLNSVCSIIEDLKAFMQTVPDQVKVALGASVQEFEKMVEGQNSQIERLRKQNLILTIIVVVGIIVMAVIKFA